MWKQESKRIKKKKCHYNTVDVWEFYLNSNKQFYFDMFVRSTQCTRVLCMLFFHSTKHFVTIFFKLSIFRFSLPLFICPFSVKCHCLFVEMASFAFSLLPIGKNHGTGRKNNSPGIVFVLTSRITTNMTREGNNSTHK